MKTQELRIGNYVNYKGAEVIWTSDDFGEIDHSDIMSFVKPIPLTEQWLKDLGFERNSNYFTIKTSWYFDISNIRQQTKLKIKFTSARNWRVESPANRSIYITSIHQLQNLYFALTGKELTKE